MKRALALMLACILVESAVMGHVFADVPLYERVNTSSPRVLYSPNSMYSDAEIDFAMDRSGFYRNWTSPDYEEQDILDLQWQTTSWPVGYGERDTSLPTPELDRSRSLFIRQDFLIPEGPDQPVIVNIPSPYGTIPTFFDLSGVLYIDGTEYYRSNCCQDVTGDLVANPGYLDTNLGQSSRERNTQVYLTTLPAGQHTLAVSAHPFASRAQSQSARVEIYRPINTKIWSGTNGTDWSDDGNWLFGKPLEDEVAVFLGEDDAVTVNTDVTISGMSFHRYDRTVDGPGSITFHSPSGNADIVSASFGHTLIQTDIDLKDDLNLSIWGDLELVGDIAFNGHAIQTSLGTLILDSNFTDAGNIRLSRGGSNVNLVNNGVFHGTIRVDDDAFRPTIENNGTITGSVIVESETRFRNHGVLDGSLESNESSISGDGQITGDTSLSGESIAFGNLSFGGHVTLQDSIIDPGDVTTQQDFRQQNAGAISIAGNLLGDAEIDLFRYQVFDSIHGGGGAAQLGSVRIDVPRPFQPRDGSEFAIFPGWQSITIANLDLPDVEPGSWDTSRLLSEGILVFNVDEGVSNPFGCDFNQDGFCDLEDLDSLTVTIYHGVNDLTFDLTEDGVVDGKDTEEWLNVAAVRNGFASSYLFGDANLDGGVDAADLMTIGISWQQTDVRGWSQADFNADGAINREDLNYLALNWQARTPPANAVPEPVGVLLALLGSAFLIRMGRRVCTGRAIVVFLWTAVTFVAVSDTDAQFPPVVVAEDGPFRLLSTPQIARARMKRTPACEKLVCRNGDRAPALLPLRTFPLNSQEFSAPRLTRSRRRRPRCPPV